MSVRVALLSTNYNPVTCGVGDHSMRTAQELHRRGVEAHVVAGAPVLPHPEAPDVPLHALPRHAPPQAAALLDLLASLRPTHLWVQYTHHALDGTRFGKPLLLALLAGARAAGVRTLVMAHELFPPSFPRPDLWVAARTTRAQFGAVLHLADAVAVSTHARLALVEQLATQVHARLHPVMVPIAPNALPVARARMEGGPHVGTFSTLAVGKRLDVVVQAFARVVERHPGAQLWLLGDLSGGGARLQATLDSALAGHPARHAIHLTGRLELAQVAQRVAGLDAFVFPSDVGATTRSGTLPLALGTALPVVSWQGPDTGPWFVHGENVHLAPALEAEPVAQGLLEVLSDAAYAQRLGLGARALYAEHLSWERVVDRLCAAAELHT